MRRQLALCVVGVMIVLTLFLHCFSTVLRTVLLDKVPYALSKEELAVEQYQPHSEGATTIPNIIHQIYLGFDNKAMPPDWEEVRQSCVDLNLEYEYKVQETNGRSHRRAFAKHFPVVDKRVGSRSAYDKIPLVPRDLDPIPI